MGVLRAQSLLVEARPAYGEIVMILHSTARRAPGYPPVKIAGFSAATPTSNVLSRD